MTNPQLRLRVVAGEKKSANIIHQKPKKKITSSEECDIVEETKNSIIGNILKILLFVIAVPPMLNYASLKQEREYLMQNVTLYDVGFGQKLYMSCIGEGKPTVILDAPTGMTSDSWIRGQLELSQVTRVCVYDRAGLGWSEPAPWLNTSDPGQAAVANTLGPASTLLRMASDLHRLITFAHPQERPLVLVGAELGGLVARVYSQIHPQDVHHLVMVDPLSETLFDDVNNVNDAEKAENPWLGYWFGHLLSSLRLLQISAMVGLARIGLVTGMMVTPGDRDLDTTVKIKHQLCDPFLLQGVIDEHRTINETFRQMASIGVSAKVQEKVTSTVISGSSYDLQLPQQLNRGWSRAVQDVIMKTDSRHHVISDADRSTLLGDHVSQVLAPVVKIVKNWQLQNSHKSK